MMITLNPGRQLNTEKEQVPHFAPEEQLLLTCARTTLDESQQATLRRLAPLVSDWACLRSLAWRHGAFPLLYLNLEQHCAGGTPPGFLAELREDYRANAWRSLIYTGELTTLLQRLEDTQIRAITYKGPTLSSMVYGDISHRHFIDVDVLVSQADIPLARVLLIDSGYEELSHLDGKPSTVEHALKFYNPQSDAVVELHWNVIPGYIVFPLDFSELWQRAQRVVLGGASAVTFAPEDLFLVLCIHGYRHNWHSLKWVCDVNQFLQTYPQLDWDQTLARAQRLGSKLALLFAVRLSHALLGSPLPDPVQGALQSAKLERSVNQVAQRLFSAEVDGEQETDKLLTYLEMRERVWDKAKYLRFAMGTKMRSGRRHEKDPRYRAALYQLARLGRLLRNYGARPLIRFLRTLRS